MQKSIYTEQYGLLLKAIRVARKAAGISQVELAERLQLTQSSVGKCERGERRLDVVELREWCLAIGTTLGDVVQELEQAIARLEELKTLARKSRRKTVRQTSNSAPRKTLRRTLRKNRPKIVG